MRPLLPFLLLALTACSRSTPSATSSPSPAVPVQATRVAAETHPLIVEAPATVRPAERAVIAAKLSGTVATLPHGLGQAVAAGEILLTLNTPESEARVRQAHAQLAEAQRTRDREQTLVAKGVNAPDAQRDAEDHLRYAQAAAAEAEAVLANATVRAPFAGVVTEKFVLPGDLATPGLRLLVLESTHHLRAEGSIPEKAAAPLRLGSTLGVVLDEAAPPVTGTVEELSTAADAISRTVLVKVALPPQSARSGQFARLQVVTGETPALLIPLSALTRYGQMERVFVIADGRAHLRLVKTGRPTATRVEILSGLRAGESVVLNPPAAFRDGQPVIVQP